MNHKSLILHLSLIEGAGPGCVKTLLERKPENFKFEDFYNLSINDFKNFFCFSETLAKKVKEGLENKKLFDEELNLIEKNKIKWSTFIDNDYPELLKNIHLPPSVIYWQGRDFDNNDKLISIIGSRKANDYAKKVIDSLVKNLVANQWSIVSGGALGADKMAHEAALNVDGKTISILGSGLLKPYPTSNKKLFQKIIENNGTLVSSFPLNFPALPENFPARNRIISGLSKGCIVVQAAIKSGTRITALHALDQGRDVFAIPGQIDDELSSGCNKLIQEGAKLVTCVEDILEEYGEIVSKKTIQNNVQIEQINSIDFQIIESCRLPITIDEIRDKTGIEINELQFKLFELQLNGKLKQDFAGLWQKN